MAIFILCWRIARFEDDLHLPRLIHPLYILFPFLSYPLTILKLAITTSIFVHFWYVFDTKQCWKAGQTVERNHCKATKNNKLLSFYWIHPSFFLFLIIRLLLEGRATDCTSGFGFIILTLFFKKIHVFRQTSGPFITASIYLTSNGGGLHRVYVTL